MSYVDPSRVYSEPKVIAFCEAAQRGNIAEMTRLAREGVNINAVGEKNLKPIIFAMLAPSANPLQLILSWGADPNTRLDSGETPLYYSMQKSGGAFTQLLLQAGARVDIPGPADRPILHYAVFSLAEEQMLLLLRANADVNFVYRGSHLLSDALAIEYFRGAQLLVEAGADFKRSKDSDGINFLDALCRVDFASYLPKFQMELQGLWQSLELRKAPFPCPRPF